MRWRRASLALIALTAAGVLVCAPLVGSPRLVRLPAVLVPALVLALLAVGPSRWRDLAGRAAVWRPSAHVVWSVALVVGVTLFWYVLTRFRSGEINAIDFTVYYDRPCFQTIQGRPLFVEVSDTPGLSHRSELGDHAYWAMFAVCAPYALFPTPLWLHALSATAVVAGAVYVLRILARVGVGGALAGAGALAFVLNDNTARTLNYGFHPEVLYAWFVPWMIDAGLRRAPRSFLAATVATVLVKEDAFLPIFAVCVGLGLHLWREMTRVERALYLAFPVVLGLGNVAAYYGLVLPRLGGDTRPAYAHFWGNYGATPWLALTGMMAHPLRVAAGVASSGLLRVLTPHLLLPVIGWRWAVGTLPIVVLYGASANDQVRAFGIYYAIVLVPFLVLAGATGARAVARRLIADGPRAELAAAGAVLLGALLVGAGSRGYSLRPWKAEIAAMPEAVRRLSGEPVVLVQSGLFPHAGYDQRFRLLTPETLDDPGHGGGVVLYAARVGAYPFKASSLAEGLDDLPSAGDLPAGLRAARLPDWSGCDPPSDEPRSGRVERSKRRRCP